MSEVKNFKVGQVWKSRGGEEFTIVSVEGASKDFPIVVTTPWDSGYTFSTSGYFYGEDTENDLDLIELVKDVPEETPSDTTKETPKEISMKISKLYKVSISYEEIIKWIRQSKDIPEDVQIDLEIENNVLVSVVNPVNTEINSDDDGWVINTQKSNEPPYELKDKLNSLIQVVFKNGHKTVKYPNDFINVSWNTLRNDHIVKYRFLKDAYPKHLTE
jgi:replicative superfamily II helicase